MAESRVLGCPFDGRDDRKTAGTAPAAEAQITIDGFGLARQILRGGGVRQGGFRAELLERFTARSHAPVLFQEGDAHRRQRSATARFFAPKLVATRYRELMERLGDSLIARLRRDGRARLDDMSLEMAVGVAAEIIGLTASDERGMARRLNRFFAIRMQHRNVLPALVSMLRSQYRLLAFYLRDVRPAIRARRRERREDVISHLIDQDYSDREILVECLTYGAAGMVTTREFIVMAAWHLFEREDLRARFLSAAQDERIAILEEILRLEPVVGAIYRRADRELTLEAGGQTIRVPAESLVALDVRNANTDAGIVGEFPYRLDPARMCEGANASGRASGSVMSFGDGPHRCPGAGVALEEAAVFLERLFSVPRITLARAPDITWNPVVAGYELRGAIVATG